MNISTSISPYMKRLPVPVTQTLKHLIFAIIISSLTAAYCQPIKIGLTASEKLTQSLSQSLLPIAVEIASSSGSMVDLNFFDLCYCGSVTENSAKFIIAAKTGKPDIVRAKHLIERSLCNDKAALLNSILSNPEAPDPIVIGFVDASWSSGLLSFRISDLSVVVKTPDKKFEDELVNQIKESAKLNYDIVTKDMKIKVSDSQSIPIHVRPFFFQDKIAFTIAPSELFRIDELVKPSSEEMFDDNSNAILNVDYGFLNFLSVNHFANEKIKLDKGGFKFEISAFRFFGNENGLKASCNIFSTDIDTNFDGDLNIRKDLTLENCDIRPQSNNFVARGAASLAKSQVNGKFKDKPLVRDSDLRQEFPLKIREKEYVLYLQVSKAIPLIDKFKINSDLFLESH
ncbi:hypothetical protein [Dyadobacter bucti]|uniref:hypothetical protein n=1 Tax=Dyadobacter bucti TaxID=2572203 RepID=UPI00140C7877|nr:hypothetical protein [Dyadobacter bucti]